MNKKEYKANIAYLEENGVSYCGLAWEDKKFSAELESYTDAGGDMIISLEELTKESLQRYLEDFDIDEEVMLWWSETTSKERSKRGLPFDNIRQHYEDLESWLDRLKEVCKNVPY